MKNRLAIYSKLLRDNLTKEGCEFIIQKAEPVSNSIILRFHHNHVLENSIGKMLLALNCTYRMEYGADEVTILLQL